MNHTPYAGFWLRLAASLIDMIIVFIVIFIPLSLIYGEEYWNTNQLFLGFWDVILNYVIPFIVTIWFWLRFFGTPGKMALRLHIVDAKTGSKMTLGQAVFRYFAYLVAVLPLGLGLFWIGIDKKKQGWHDKLAGTVVLKNGQSDPDNPEHH